MTRLTLTALLTACLLGACASTAPQQDTSPSSERNALPRNWTAAVPMPALANAHPTLPLPDAATLGLLAGAVVAGAMLGHLKRADD